MNKKIFFLAFIFFASLHQVLPQTCSVSAYTSLDTIICGEATVLSAHGTSVGQLLLFENFNTGAYSPGWSSTNQALWYNPCSELGVDGSPHIWMGNASGAPRIITSPSTNLSSCTSNVILSFDMLFADQSSFASSCQGPDLPNEGVYVQYSTNGQTWNPIHYFDPHGGHDTTLTRWRNWYFTLPTSAITTNTRFRWLQNDATSDVHDHWGIDNVRVYCNNTDYTIRWIHDGYISAVTGGNNPTPVTPHLTTNYVVELSNGINTCRDSVTVTVIDSAQVIDAYITASSGCIGSPTQTNIQPLAQLIDLSNLSFSWYPVTGVNNTTISNPVISAMQSATYWVTATNTANGCRFIDSIHISAGQPFNVTLPNDTFSCSTTGITIGGYHSAGLGAIYHWSPAHLVSDSMTLFTTASPRNTTIFQLAVTSAQGCTVKDSIVIEVPNLLNFSVGNDTTLCNGQSAQLNVSQRYGCGALGNLCNGIIDSIHIGIMQANGSFVHNTPFFSNAKSRKGQFILLAAELSAQGLPAGATINSISFIANTANSNTPFTNFTVKMVCTNQNTATAAFIPNLTTVFSPKPYTPVAGINTLTFDNTYNWDGFSNLVVETCYFNDSTFTPTSVYYTTSPNSVLATYAFEDTGACNLLTGTTTNRRPDVRLRYCTNQIEGFTYAWQPAQTVTNPNIPNPIASPGTTTTYSIKATGTSSGCILTDSINVYVANSTLTIETTSDTIVCSAIGLQLFAAANSIAPLNYTWQPAQYLNSNTVAAPYINTEGSRQYTVTVADKAGCAASHDTINILVLPKPYINASANQSVCQYDTAQLFVQGGVSCIWSPAYGLDNINSRTPYVSHTFMNDYHYIATIYDSLGCTAKDTVRISVLPYPTINLGNDTVICSNALIQLSAGHYSDILWSDGASGYTLLTGSPGLYWARITDQCAIVSDSIVIDTIPAPTVGIYGDSTLCAGQSVLLSASSSVSNYFWSTLDVTQSTTASLTGFYSVTVTADNNCSASAMLRVMPADSLFIYITPTHTTCGYSNGSALVNVLPTTGNYQYTWSNGETSPAIDSLTAGSYYVTVTNNIICPSRKMISINSSTLPDVLITTSGNPICAGDSAQICAPQGPTAFAWNTGQTSRCIYALSAGTYYVTAAYGAGCTVESNHVLVSFYPVSPVSISVSGDTLRAFNSNSYQWYLNNNLISGADNDMWVALEPGMYTVEVLDTNGCYIRSLPITITTTGVNAHVENEINVYPNPIKEGNWTIYITNPTNNTFAEIFDVTGRKVFEMSITDKHTVLPFNTARGVYVLYLKINEKEYIYKLIRL